MAGRPVNPAPDAFRLIVEAGFSGAIGGVGQVLGAAGGKDVTVLRRPGRITFDPSFNAGGDVIRLPGDATDWRVSLSGSSAAFRLASDNLKVMLPVGMAGASVAFADGARALRYDEAAQAVMLGDQAVGADPAAIAAAPDTPAPPARARGGVAGRVYIQSGSTISLDGHFEVFGRSDASDCIEIGGGAVLLDPSFKASANEIRILAEASRFTASIAGSTLRLVSETIDLTVPVGMATSALVFGSAHEAIDDARDLAFVEARGGVVLGGQLIGAGPALLAPR